MVSPERHMKSFVSMFTVFSVNSMPLFVMAPAFTQGEVITPFT